MSAGQRFGRVAEWVAGGTVAAGWVATLAGFVDAWPLAVLANVRAQLAAVLGGASLLLALRRSWLLAFLGAGAAVLDLALLRPLWRREAVRGSTARLRLVAFNLLYTNRRHDDVVAWLRRSRADVLVLVEAGGAWGRVIAAAGLPFAVTRIETDHPGEGMVVLTRGEPLAAEVLSLGPRPAVAVAVPVGEGVVRVLGIHPCAPTTPRGALLQEEEFEAIAAWVEKQEDPVVVAGDANATRWYPAFRALLGAGLVDSAVGRGWQPTWSAGPLAMPIDHVLHSPELVTLSRHIGPSMGSDHRPLEVVLALRPPPMLL